MAGFSTGKNGSNIQRTTQPTFGIGCAWLLGFWDFGGFPMDAIGLLSCVRDLLASSVWFLMLTIIPTAWQIMRLCSIKHSGNKVQTV